MQLDGTKALTQSNFRPFSLASSELSFMASLHDSHTYVEPKAKKNRGDYNI